MSKPLFFLAIALILLLGALNYYTTQKPVSSQTVTEQAQDPESGTPADVTNPDGSLDNAAQQTTSAAAAEAEETEVEGAAGTSTEVTTTGEASIGGPFSLVDQNGKKVTEKTYAGKYMLVFFGFTNCPEVCPTGLQNITSLMQKLGEKAQNITPIFITVDTERDKPKTIKTYLENFHPSIQGLTGTQKQIEGAEAAYKVYANKVENPMMGVMFDHSSFIYFMDKKGKYITHFRHNSSVDEMQKKIVEMMK